jgi:hypothetical protein
MTLRIGWMLEVQGKHTAPLYAHDQGLVASHDWTGPEYWSWFPRQGEAQCQEEGKRAGPVRQRARLHQGAPFGVPLSITPESAEQRSLREWPGSSRPV